MKKQPSPVSDKNLLQKMAVSTRIVVSGERISFEKDKYGRWVATLWDYNIPVARKPAETEKLLNALKANYEKLWFT